MDAGWILCYNCPMPAYDYVCLDCRKPFDLFMSYQEYGNVSASCTHCGSAKVRRRLNRVRIAKSEESRLESLDEFEVS